MKLGGAEKLASEKNFIKMKKNFAKR